MKPKFSIFSDGAYWGVMYRNTILVLEGESYQVASNVADHANRVNNDPTECGEVADAIVSAIDRW